MDVVFVPGLMGSEMGWLDNLVPDLGVGVGQVITDYGGSTGRVYRQIWLHYTNLALCFFKRMQLAPNMLSPGNPHGRVCVRGPRPVNEFYGNIFSALKTYYNRPDDTVLQFPYDFRLDINIIGYRLFLFLNQEAYRNKNWVIVAHSMGGLVASMAKRHATINGSKLNISRLVAIGTPWYGSWDSFSTLHYCGPYINIIAGIKQGLRYGGFLSPIDLPSLGAYLPPELDSQNREITGIFGSWPSMYCLLPRGVIKARNPVLVDNFLNQIKVPWDANGAACDLMRFSTFPALEDAIELWDDCTLTQVVGTGLPTIQSLTTIGVFGPKPPEGYDPQIDSLGTVISTDGDGTVPLASAKPFSRHRSWTLNCAHNYLCNHPEVIGALPGLVEGTFPEPCSDVISNTPLGPIMDPPPSSWFPTLVQGG